MEGLLLALSYLVTGWIACEIDNRIFFFSREEGNYSGKPKCRICKRLGLAIAIGPLLLAIALAVYPFYKKRI